MSLCPYGLKKSGYFTKILVKCRILEVVETNQHQLWKKFHKNKIKNFNKTSSIYRSRTEISAKKIGCIISAKNKASNTRAGKNSTKKISKKIAHKLKIFLKSPFF